MAPIVLNTYGSRNQKRTRSWNKVNRVLKEIGNSEECISMFDGLCLRSAKKIKGGKTGIAVKEVGLTNKMRAKRKFLKDSSQKPLKIDTFKHAINKGQSGSHLTISLDTSCDTTFDRLRKAEPLQKLQPTAQCTSCSTSSGISEQIETSSNCSLFPAPRTTTRQDELSKKSSRSSCSESENLTEFRVTSTPKGANRENKLYSLTLSPIISVMHEKSEANEVEAQGITSVHSIERRDFLSSISRNPAGTQNDSSLVPLFATFKTTPSNFIELSSTDEPVQISVPANNDSLKNLTTCENHDISKDFDILSKDSHQAEVKCLQISLPSENNDSLEIISIFKNLRTSFEPHVGLEKDSTVLSNDIQIERNTEYQVGASVDIKEAAIDCESEDLSYKLIYSFAEVNRFAESNVQFHRGSKISGRCPVSPDMFADYSYSQTSVTNDVSSQQNRGSKIPERCQVSPDMFAHYPDCLTSARNDICPKQNSGTLASDAVLGFCGSLGAFSNDSNSIKSSNNVLIQDTNQDEQSSSSDFKVLNIYCRNSCSLETGKCVLNGVNISHDNRLNCDTNESINSTSYKCQGSSRKRCVQGSTNVSELIVSKHEHTSQTASNSENKCSEVTGKLDGSLQETIISTIDAVKETSPNLTTDASFQGTKLETDIQSQPLGTQVAVITERADTPSPGRPSCRRLSHLVVPQNKEVGSSQVSSFRKVYSDCNGRMSPCVEDDEEVDTSLALVSIPVKARQAVLHRCRQTEPIPFSQAFSDEFWDTCQKIGEGVYGEVFLSEAEGGVVFKVIPIEGDKLINEEPQKKYEEILSEIVIAMELSELRNGTRNNTSGFSEVKKCLCVKGRYPKPLIQLWEEYDADKGSENDCPVVFEDDQLYIILSLANGGQDLEAFCFSSADQALSVLKQTACALAVAENALEFEHRDLHWGNVLIGPTSAKSVSFTINGEAFDVATKGIQVTIIDFTLSRMTYDGCCIFNDLARDPTLFTSEGDYQFEVYRLMRDSVMNDWRNFEPFTNLLWLHYLLHKMITMVNYRRKNTKIHQKGISEMKKLSDNLLSFTSCSHFVTSSTMK